MLRRTLDLEVVLMIAYTSILHVIDNVLTSYIDLDYNSVDAAQTLSRLSLFRDI